MRILVVAACLCQASPSLRTAHASDVTTPDVIVAAAAPNRSTFFPTIAALRNGELLVVYYDSPDHVSQGGRISLVRSADEGRTWSAPRPIVDTPYDDRDPSVVELRDGTLLLNFFVRDWSVAPGLSLGVYVARSDDHGVTWQPPVKVDTALGRPTVPGGPSTSARIVELDNDDLLLPLYGAGDTDDQRSSVVRSTDRGRTWPRANETIIGYRPGINLVEPAVATLGGGRLIAKMRSERSDNLGYQSQSVDGGRTWSPVTKTTLGAQASDVVPFALAGRSTALVLHAWGDFSSQFGIGRPTVIDLEDPDGIWTFARPRVVYHGGCSWGDESYPSMAPLRDGRVLIVYYDACRGYIGGTYLTLLDIARIPAPGVPSNVTASVNANAVTLRWSAAAAGGLPTSYLIEAGSSPAATDLTRFETGTAATAFSAVSLPPRTYFVHVRAVNPAGTSGPSADVSFTIAR